jgi:organic radical activating enzyme
MTFFPDVNIGPSALAKKYSLTGKLLVRSIFHTWQGEAPYSGISAVFLRLGGCNRGKKEQACKFCDTNFLMSESKLMTFAEIAQKISNLKLLGTELLVITGGEPLLQQDSLAKFLEYITSAHILHLTVQIETNGDYAISKENAVFNDCVIVCSPKAWDGKERPFKSLALGLDDINAFRFLISRSQKEYSRVPQEILNIYSSAQYIKPYLYLSPITEYYENSTEAERQKGWAGNAINYQLTLENYSHAVTVAKELLAQGISAKLSSQTHLLYSID